MYDVGKGIVTVEDHSLVLPGELAAAMGLARSSRVRMRPEQEGCYFLSSVSNAFAYRRLKLMAGKLLLGIHTGWELTVRNVDQSGRFWLALPRKCPVTRQASSSYKVVNYHPNYYLMPVQEDTIDEGIACEDFWRQIEGYHEHQEPKAQDESAHRVSQWFASEIVKPLDPQTILEVGCGSGRNASYLVDAMPRVEYTGVDANTSAIRVAEGLGLKRTRFLVRSIYGLQEFAERSFDVVFSMGVMMHIPHTRVVDTIRNMLNLSRRACLHFELHGLPHGFDYHRYPRDYHILYMNFVETKKYGISYWILNRDDPLNAGEGSGQMALLTARRLD
jgi:SAM-dependent methyltransferase